MKNEERKEEEMEEDWRSARSREGIVEEEEEERRERKGSVEEVKIAEEKRRGRIKRRDSSEEQRKEGRREGGRRKYTMVTHTNKQSPSNGTLNHADDA